MIRRCGVKVGRRVAESKWNGYADGAKRYERLTILDWRSQIRRVRIWRAGLRKVDDLSRARLGSGAEGRAVGATDGAGGEPRVLLYGEHEVLGVSIAREGSDLFYGAGGVAEQEDGDSDPGSMDVGSDRATEQRYKALLELAAAHAGVPRQGVEQQGLVQVLVDVALEIPEAGFFVGAKAIPHKRGFRWVAAGGRYF